MQTFDLEPVVQYMAHCKLVPEQQIPYYVRWVKMFLTAELPPIRSHPRVTDCYCNSLTAPASGCRTINPAPKCHASHSGTISWQPQRSLHHPALRIPPDNEKEQNIATAFQTGHAMLPKAGDEPNRHPTIRLNRASWRMKCAVYTERPSGISQHIAGHENRRHRSLGLCAPDFHEAQSRNHLQPWRSIR